MLKKAINNLLLETTDHHAKEHIVKEEDDLVLQVKYPYAHAYETHKVPEEDAQVKWGCSWKTWQGAEKSTRQSRTISFSLVDHRGNAACEGRLRFCRSLRGRRSAPCAHSLSGRGRWGHLRPGTLCGRGPSYRYRGSALGPWQGNEDGGEDCEGR